jgi:hypothetical protein
VGNEFDGRYNRTAKDASRCGDTTSLRPLDGIAHGKPRRILEFLRRWRRIHGQPPRAGVHGIPRFDGTAEAYVRFRPRNCDRVVDRTSANRRSADRHDHIPEWHPHPSMLTDVVEDGANTVRRPLGDRSRVLRTRRDAAPGTPAHDAFGAPYLSCVSDRVEGHWRALS